MSRLRISNAAYIFNFESRNMLNLVMRGLAVMLLNAC